MKHTENNKRLWLLAAIGLAIFAMMSYAPLLSGDDPEAAKHAIDRKGAEAAAVRFVQAQLDTDAELRPLAMYAADRNAFGYFYKVNKIDQVMDQFQTVLPLEAYRVEVKESASGVTHFVDINPYTGQPVEWELRLRGESSSPDADQLEQIGRRALDALGLGRLPSELVQADPHAGTVVFETADPAFAEARAQFTVRVDQGAVSGFAVQWLVPAEYASLIERQDAWADTLGTAGMLLSAGLQLAAMIYALAQLKHVRWSRGAVMAVIFGVIYCGMNINMYPGLKAVILNLADGGAIGDIAGFAGDSGEIIAGLISALLVTNGMTLFLAIGLYFSAVAGDNLALRQGWTVWPREEEPHYRAELAGSVWKGYLFAPVMLGLQSVIYLAAENGFRTWYTIDAISSPNNLVYPLLLPLLAWCAAFSEEAVYRLLAIPLLKRVVRFTFPAVLISSMIWALGHVQYPFYPFYTRFVEVTLIGLLFAYIFLKHGFLTAVFTHAIVDIVWMGISITANTPSVESWAAFAVYLAVPACIGLLHRRRPGGWQRA